MRKALIVGVASVALIGSWGTLVASGSPPQERAPTWTDDIAPLMAVNCMGCHRPGEVSPMSLLTYEDVVPWARSIRMVVSERIMPPWHADPRYGDFANERRLTEKEIGTLVDWVAAGAPRGSGTFTPPTFPTGWALDAELGPPDYIFELEEEFLVPAAGPDIIHHVMTSTTHKEDIWIRAIEARGNSRVVHHINVDAYWPDGTWDGLALAVPGRQPDLFPDGSAHRLPVGSQFRVEMHYHPNGEEQVDRTKVGVWLARTPIEYEIRGSLVTDQSFEIPPYEPNYESVAEREFDEEVELLLMTPHMHYRGKDMRFQAIHPDGREETLLFVPQYNMYWQIAYVLAKPTRLAKGSKLRVTSHFDNSENNPWNPNPSVRVIWGMDSRDEMMEGWIHYRRKLAEPVIPSYDAEITGGSGAR